MEAHERIYDNSKLDFIDGNDLSGSEVQINGRFLRTNV